MRSLAFALMLSLAAAACTQPASIDVQDAWARETVASATNAAVYMTITASTPDRLVGASTPVAAKTDLMTMEGGNGAMGMKYLKAIDIPANRPVRLDSGGLHVWLADLKQPLKAGQRFPLTLWFEKAGERQVSVAIVEPAAAPPMSDMRM